MSLFWCKRCNVPIYKDTCTLCGEHAHEFAHDVRPVFPEEVLLLEILLGHSGSLRGKSVWNAKGNRYYVNGEHINFSLQDVLNKWDPQVVRRLLDAEKNQVLEELNEEFAIIQERFVRANIDRYREIENESMTFIQKVAKRYKDREIVVSFSGGKDSTVVSSLVRRALGTPKITHIFGDTTLEIPHTYKYVDKFRKSNRWVPFFVPRSQHTFLDLCDEIGPPSRVMRWCCTVFKTGPIGDILDRCYGSKQILTFYGVRRSESTRRSKYEEVTYSPKIAKQIVASPIMSWTDLDIWLYLFSADEEFNEAYRAGFARVGCWCCPSNSDWSFFLAQVLIPEEAKGWSRFLVSFAKRIGKPDPEEYVASGNWKARQGGNGLGKDHGTVKFEPCATEILARNYQLSKPIGSQLYEYFKPFGTLDFGSERNRVLGEVYVIDRDTKERLLVLQGREGQNHLKITAERSENSRLLITRVECQLRKFQSCLACGGCPSICPSKAITLVGDQYHIVSDRCVGCMKCIAHYDLGCLVTKVTKTRRSPA